MSDSSTERNLLLAIEVNRSERVSRNHLIEALRVWAADRSRSVGQVLVDKQWISETDRRELERRVDERIQSHDNDPLRSLEAARSEDPEFDEISSEFLPDLKDHLPKIDSMLPGVGETPSDDSPPATTDYVENPSLAGGRFRILNQHAEGGLGRVMLALDDELGRKVAVKEIKPRYADHLQSQERFVLEAEVTGGLEHPGIVPVYSLGHYSDGRPYYAMRFIRGESMHAAIEAFHRVEQLPRDRAKWMLALRKLLRRFVDLCHAIDYAHSKGVVHRDIKPANVMLGKFGETLVVDWGLAKIVGNKAAAATDETMLSPRSGGSSSATLAGSAIGTPAYMSPEQAKGDVERMGPATDIYSLGATLFCLLTGQPPFRERQSSLEKVKLGQFPRPRQLRPDIPVPLESICLKAMARLPEDRYTSIGQLIEDLEHWMADETVSAYRETAAERLGRWMRRHRVWMQAGGLALIAVALVSVCATLVVLYSWREEQQAKKRGFARFLQAREAVDRWLSSAGEVLAYYPAMQDTRANLLERAAQDYASFVGESSDDYELELERARTFMRLGNVYLDLSDHSRALESYRTAGELFRQLQAERPERGDSLTELANSFINLGVVLKETRQFDEAEALFQQAIDVLQKQVGAHNNEHIARESLAKALNNYGELLLDIDRRDDAESELRRCLDVLGDENPDDERSGSRGLLRATAQQLLGRVCLKMGRCDEAIGLQQMAIRTTRASVQIEPNEPRYRERQATANEYLASILRPLGRYMEEEKAHQAAIDTYEAMSEVLPGVTRLTKRLAFTWINLAGLSHKVGRIDEAEQQLTQADRLLAPFASGLEDSRSSDLDEIHETMDLVAYFYHIRGVVLRDRGMLQEAKESLTEAFRLYDRLVTSNADRPTRHLAKYIESYAGTASHLAQTLHLLGDDQLAGQIFQRAVDTAESVSEPSPGSLDRRAFIYLYYADMLQDVGESEKANLVIVQARSLWKDLGSVPEAVPEHRNNWARFLANCPIEQQRDSALAVEVAKALTEEVPKNGAYWNTLGIALYRTADYPGAIDALNEAARWRSHGMDLLFLAMAHKQLDHREESAKSLQRGTQWVDEYLPKHRELRRTSKKPAHYLATQTEKMTQDHDLALASPNAVKAGR